MAKLHSVWSQIAADYDRLWNHTSADDAEQELEQIIEKEREPSELATQEAPNDQQRLGQWQQHVFSMYHLTNQRG
jgi:hypothetical protein